MNRPIRHLGDLERAGGSVQAECRKCRRTALFAVGELLAHFRRRGWDQAWPGSVAVKLRCAGCGSRMPNISWCPSEPPSDDDPPPPRPRLVRAQRLPVPLGVDRHEWEKARTDRDRRQLIRRARD